MFLKSFKSRITLAFTAVFLVCSAALFFLAYFVTSQATENEERALLRSRLLEFWAVYQTGNVDLVRTELTLQRVYRDDRPFSLRIADAQNVTRLIYPPPEVKDYPFALLESLPPMRDGDILSLRNQASGRELTVAAVQLSDGDILEIGISDTLRLRTMVQFRESFLIVLLPLVLMSVLGGLFFSTRFLRPVKKMVTGIKEIMATGDIHKRIGAAVERSGPAGDELGALMRLFNGLLDQIESLVGGMRETLDNVAHDVRTPLTRLRSAAENALAAAPDPAALTDALHVCLTESEQVLGLLSALLEISRAQSGIMTLDKRPVDLAELIADFADLYSYPAAEKNIRLITNAAGPLAVPADVNRLRQALSNLIENALRHAPAGSAIELAARADGDGAVLSVKDSGSGIPAADLPRIWERFYRGRNAAGQPGFGLGLSLAKAIVEAHGGTVSAGNEANGGAVFTFRLPRG